MHISGTHRRWGVSIRIREKFLSAVASMKNALLLLLIPAALTVLLLEIGIGLGTKLELFWIKVPIYSIAQARNPFVSRDVNRDSGFRHLPHTTTRHSKSCFDVHIRADQADRRKPAGQYCASPAIGRLPALRSDSQAATERGTE